MLEERVHLNFLLKRPRMRLSKARAWEEYPPLLSPFRLLRILEARPNVKKNVLGPPKAPHVDELVVMVHALITLFVLRSQ